MSRRRWAGDGAKAIWVALMLLGGTSRAQSTDDVNAAIQFNFSNPGARSLGMGGAFTARADDATAVFANPAGLLQLGRAEVSLDGRGWRTRNSFLRGSADSAASLAERLEVGRTNDTLAGLSFLSALYPGKSGRWVVGVSGHETANFETSVRSDGALLDINSQGQCRNSAKVRPLDGFLRSQCVECRVLLCPACIARALDWRHPGPFRLFAGV